MNSYSRLVMFGAAPETRGSIAAVVEAYRAHGLFKRWTIDYLPSHGGGSAGRNAKLALDALRRFGLLLARHGRMPVHLHISARGSPAADAALAAAALAARCPLLLQLHGAGFERAHGGALLRHLLARAACVRSKPAPCSWTMSGQRAASAAAMNAASRAALPRALMCRCTGMRP